MEEEVKFNWQDKINIKLIRLRNELIKDSAKLTYGALGSAAIYPVIEAMQNGDPSLLLALTGGIGAGYLSDQLKGMIEAGEDKAPQLIQERAETDEKFLQAMDAVIKKMNVIEETQQIMPDEWGRNLKSFIETLPKGTTINQDENSILFKDVTNYGTMIGKAETVFVNEQKDLEKIRFQEKLEAYLKEVIRYSSFLPMSPFADDDTDITLDQIYIDLDTTEKRDWKNEQEKDEYQKKNNFSEFDLIFEDLEKKPVSALEAVENNTRLVLLGDPGSGKSTFIKKIAGSAAHSNLNGESGVFSKIQCIPVIFELRNAYNFVLPAVNLSQKGKMKIFEKALEEYIAQQLSEWKIDLEVNKIFQIIKDYPILLIFDGMDEVPQNDRKIVREWLKYLCKSYQPEKVIVTCRIRSYFEEAVLSNFASFTLAPFTEKQIEDFTTAWYNSKPILNTEQKKERSGDFFKRISADKKILEMASNPMLLTQMAFLHQKNTKLPDKRVKLYKEIIDLLLYRWQDHHSVKFPTSDELKTLLTEETTIRRSLETLAFETHKLNKNTKDAKADLPYETALGVFAKPENLNKYGLAEEFLHYLDQRCGLLQGRGGTINRPGSFTFPHRTFQEYLAGCYISRQKQVSKIKLLKTLAGEGDFWDIVFKMSIEERFHIGEVPDLPELAFQLSGQENLSSERNQRLAYWAALVGELVEKETFLEYDDPEEEDFTGSKHLERNREQILSLFSGKLAPLEKTESGNALAILGDPRFNDDLYYLPKDDMLGFVDIPAGSFLMGSDPKKDRYAQEEEQPQHPVDLEQYYLAKYPVTVGQWRTYAKKANIKLSDDWKEDNQYTNHPVVRITWHEALKYCQWLTAELKNNPDTPAKIKDLLQKGRQIILPSEAEWEKAARGTEGLIYPYGDQFDPQKGNVSDTRIGTTSTVGCFADGFSPFDCFDMSGNVWEWTRSLYKDYKYDPNDGREDLDDSGLRVLRGGSFDHDGLDARCARRGWNLPANGDNYIGFRLALPH